MSPTTIFPRRQLRANWVVGLIRPVLTYRHHQANYPNHGARQRELPITADRTEADHDDGSEK